MTLRDNLLLGKDYFGNVPGRVPALTSAAIQSRLNEAIATYKSYYDQLQALIESTMSSQPIIEKASSELRFIDAVQVPSLELRSKTLTSGV